MEGSASLGRILDNAPLHPTAHTTRGGDPGADAGTALTQKT
jgi:hypothetical protein